MKLVLTTLLRVLSGLLLLRLLLFLPAGTLHYPNGWLFLALLFLPMLAVGAVLLCKDRAMLEKRMRMLESEPEQKRVILISGLQFTACFVLAGLDFRFGWSHFPLWLTVLGSVLLPYPLVLNKRIQNEEAVLEKGLAGYAEYKKKVKYRMLPFVW